MSDLINTYRNYFLCVIHPYKLHTQLHSMRSQGEYLPFPKFRILSTKELILYTFPFWILTSILSFVVDKDMFTNEIANQISSLSKYSNPIFDASSTLFFLVIIVLILQCPLVIISLKVAISMSLRLWAHFLDIDKNEINNVTLSLIPSIGLFEIITALTAVLAIIIPNLEGTSIFMTISSLLVILPILWGIIIVPHAGLVKNLKATNLEAFLILIFGIPITAILLIAMMTAMILAIILLIVLLFFVFLFVVKLFT